MHPYHTNATTINRSPPARVCRWHMSTDTCKQLDRWRGNESDNTLARRSCARRGRQGSLGPWASAAASRSSSSDGSPQTPGTRWFIMFSSEWSTDIHTCSSLHPDPCTLHEVYDVCARAGERQIEGGCVREIERERERESVCVCVCQRASERAREQDGWMDM